MTQYARPSTFTSATWTGTAANLADSNDGTYVESPTSPAPSQQFLSNLTAVVDPGVDTGHQIRVRARLDPPGGQGLGLILQVENSDDGSVVALKSYPSLPGVLGDIVLTLTAVEAARIHSYGGLRIRGYRGGVVGTLTHG